MTNEYDLKTELEEVDARIKELNDEIELGNDIEDLHKYPAFQRVIEKAFMDDEAQRILRLLTVPMNLKQEKNEVLVEKLKSIRHVREFFKTSLIAAQTARENIDEVKLDRENITARNADTPIDVEVS